MSEGGSKVVYPVRQAKETPSICHHLEDRDSSAMGVLGVPPRVRMDMVPIASESHRHHVHGLASICSRAAPHSYTPGRLLDAGARPSLYATCGSWSPSQISDLIWSKVSGMPFLSPTMRYASSCLHCRT